MSNFQMRYHLFKMDLRCIAVIIPIAGILMLSGPVHSATVCRLCDNRDPTGQTSDNCSQNRGDVTVCKGQDDFCLAQFEMTSSGLHVKKGCASNLTCEMLWYQSTKDNPNCRPDLLAVQGTGRPPVGTVCGFCCRPPSVTPHPCNGDIYSTGNGVEHLGTYPDIAGHPTVPQSITTRPSIGYSSEPQTESLKPSIVTAPQTNISIPSTASDVPVATSVTDTASSMRCARCTYDPNQSTCADPSPQMCFGDRPLCMTSYYHEPGNITTVKRCASIEECSTLWWRDTSYRDDCMSDTKDPYSWDGTKVGQCHYCCQTVGDSPYDWCNKAPFPIKPKNLVNMPAYLSTSTGKYSTLTQVTSRMTTRETTTKQAYTAPSSSFSSSSSSFSSSSSSSSSPSLTTSGKTSVASTTRLVLTPATTKQPDPTSVNSGVLCAVCIIDAASGRYCEDKDVEYCPVSYPICMNTAHFTSEHGLTMTVQKRCTSEIECVNEWTGTSSNPACSGDLTDTAVIGSTCSYCCNTSDASGVPCNFYTRPAHVLTFQGQARTTSTTTTPTTIATTTTTRPTSPAVTETTSSSSSSSSSSLSSSSSSLSLSPPLSSSSSSAATTAPVAATTSATPTAAEVTTAPVATTAAAKPTAAAATTAPVAVTASATPTAPEATTAPVAATTAATPTATAAAASPSTLATAAMTTTPDTTVPGSGQNSTLIVHTFADATVSPTGTRSCYQCGNETAGKPCEAIDILVKPPAQCPPGLNYCLNTIDQSGGRAKVYKRCTDLVTCEREWYRLSSDNPLCQSYTLQAAVLCHFCCVSDDCNKPYKPADNTLWTP